MTLSGDRPYLSKLSECDRFILAKKRATNIYLMYTKLPPIHYFCPMALLCEANFLTTSYYLKSPRNSCDVP